MFSGILAGIKKNSTKQDLGLIFCEPAASAAALFTRNKVVAAPVIFGREQIKSGSVSAILVNSGNANCFTGEQGLENAKKCAQLTASHLKIPQEQVIVSSTGVIGQQLPMDKFESGIPDAVKALDEQGINDFATAILTTDLRTKIVEKDIMIDNQKITVLGIAKGSGMIRPDMATMLAFICTDAVISPENLKKTLSRANEKSFNRITVDGDTSTNDTVFALANGSSGVTVEHDASISIFQDALNEICLELAKKIVVDGEGATKLVQITVQGAKTDKDAYLAAEAIAHSPLVKTAINGEDPNWGRITAAAGRSGAQVDQDKMALYFNDTPLVLDGKWLGLEAENKTAQIMKGDEIFITLDLNLGDCSEYYFFCDFSEKYVQINADYRS